MTDFRPWTICLSISQANLNHFTSDLKTQIQFTFAHLRYFLGGYRPSKTTHYIMSYKLV